ncbi:MAG TPA: MFS transporter [Gemmatimonadaceae bacterium]|nr:MFS transporter [Gemmatimonadaceae bacterium]
MHHSDTTRQAGAGTVAETPGATLIGTAAASRRARLAASLALERNVVAVSVAMLLMALGEELWKRFIPKYLEALGAPVLAVGLYGSARDLLDGVYQYPGGWLADHYGRRRALLLFVALAAVGYATYLAASHWALVFVGLVFVMAWSSMASPALFAVVGDALPRERRAMGFTVQSILRRVPIVVAPALGGLLIAAYGVRGGVRAGLVASLALSAVTLAAVWRVRIPHLPQPAPTGIAGVWRALPRPLRWLLASDVFVRTCEGLVDVFVVLYVTSVLGFSAPQFGALVAVQMVTAILVYVPAARLADRVGRKPFVIATFLAFSSFPLAVVFASGFGGLVVAFIIGGLREIGEPARKALIVDLAVPHLRARSVGLYYLVRSLAVAPAATVGAALWAVTPVAPFLVAAAVGLVGALVFAITVDESQAG